MERLRRAVHDVLTKYLANHFDQALVFGSTGGSKPAQRGAEGTVVLARSAI